MTNARQRINQNWEYK